MAEIQTQKTAANGLGSGPLRVLFYLFFPASGIGRYTHELVSRLADSPEVEIELACLPSYHWREATAYRVWPELREIGHPSPVRRKARFLLGQFANPARLCRRAAERHAEIVHFSNINLLSYPVWGRRLKRLGVKIAATVHDVRRRAAIVSAAYETRQLRQFYLDADALFVHSQAQAAELREFAGVPENKVHLVPLGPYDYGPPPAGSIDLRRQYGLPTDKQVALFFGNIRDDKNLDLFLRVLPRYQAGLHLVVAGRFGGSRDRDLAFYRRLAADLGVEQSVTFLDQYVPDDEVPLLMTLADWVAMPYSRTFTSQSGVLNVAVQYRRPVLVSATPTLAETIDRCRVGVLVEPDDSQSLDRGISEIQSLVGGGTLWEFDEYLREFGWAANAERTVAVYRQLLRGISAEPPRKAQT